MKKLWYHRFRWFVTSDGVVVLGGRDASQNEELVKKYMGGRTCSCMPMCTGQVW